MRCRFLLFPPLQAHAARGKFTFDGEVLERDEAGMKRPFALSIKGYGVGAHRLTIDLSEVDGQRFRNATWLGDIDLVDGGFYMFEEPFPSDPKFRTRPASEVEANRFTAGNDLDMPDCGHVRPGLTWVE
jgi:hypothetical protein